VSAFYEGLVNLFCSPEDNSQFSEVVNNLSCLFLITIVLNILFIRIDYRPLPKNDRRSIHIIREDRWFNEPY